MHEHRPQGPRVADQHAEPLAAAEAREARLARDRVRVELVHDVEAGGGEHVEIHGATMPRPWRARHSACVARLHHERIAGAAPERWLVMTHGIYGAGGNWRGVARRLVARRPEWGVVLVDLRQHGRSEPGEPPHTIAACADDLRALVGALAGELGGVAAIAGHSFGGKVALATRARVAVAQTWVLDASPSARPGALADRDDTVVHVLELMERLPRTWARRDDFVAAVIAAGHDAGLARWLAMNVVADPTGELALRLELGALRALLARLLRHRSVGGARATRRRRRGRDRHPRRSAVTAAIAPARARPAARPRPLDRRRPLAARRRARRRRRPVRAVAVTVCGDTHLAAARRSRSARRLS